MRALCDRANECMHDARVGGCEVAVNCVNGVCIRVRKWTQFTQAFERRKTETGAEGREENKLLLFKMART